MLTVYLNYPNSMIRVHSEPSCSAIGMQRKNNQRHFRIDPGSITRELRMFKNGDHKFASEAGRNDMWLVIDFKDVEFETAVIGYIHRLIGEHYKPLRNAQVDWHKC